MNDGDTVILPSNLAVTGVIIADQIKSLDWKEMQNLS